jgi:hypothetical protein
MSAPKLKLRHEKADPVTSAKAEVKSGAVCSRIAGQKNKNELSQDHNNMCIEGANRSLNI